MDYKEKYNTALERARKIHHETEFDYEKGMMEEIFPELKEPNDERIRKELIAIYSVGAKVNAKTGDIPDRDIVAWLEKQGIQTTDKVEPKFKPGDTMRTWREAANGYTDGMPVIVSIDNEYYHCTNELIAIKDQDDYEFPPINVKQKSSDKVEPKFKVGDWIVLPLGIIARIDSLNSTDYQVTTTDGKICDFKISKQDNYRLWTITDAKDGDVLISQSGNPLIYNGNYNSLNIGAYCGMTCDDKFKVGEEKCYWTENVDIKPSTKEQRELLFRKMEEAGYNWDAEKKELEKIEVVSKESNDEQIRKAIKSGIKHLETQLGYDAVDGVDILDIYSWLEKQGKQHPHVDVNKMVDEFANTEVKGYGIPSMIEVDAYRKGIEDALEKQGEHKPYGQRKECEDCQFNYAGECKGYCALKRNEQTQFDYEHAYIPKKDFAPIEPKFKVSDWLQYRYAEPFLVEEITEQGYCNGDSCLPFEWEDEIHLWDIQDAEDGDILVDVYGNIGIFKKCYDFDWMSYCSLGNNGGFQVFTVEHENEKTYPATKEQCKLLFQKMKEEGWEWDSENKELNKNL